MLARNFPELFQHSISFHQSSFEAVFPTAGFAVCVSAAHRPWVWTVWAATKVESNVACQWFTMTNMTTLFQHFGQHLTCSCRCEQSQNGITLFLLRCIVIEKSFGPARTQQYLQKTYTVSKPCSSPFCAGYNGCFKLSCMMLSLTFAAPSGFLGVELLSRQGQRLDRGFVGVLALLHQPSGAGHGCSTNDKPNT